MAPRKMKPRSCLPILFRKANRSWNHIRSLPFIFDRCERHLGFLAPEYVATGQLTEKSDVYAFGVVLLSLVTGRRPTDTSRDEEQVSCQEVLVCWSFEDCCQGSAPLLWQASASWLERRISKVVAVLKRVIIQHLLHVSSLSRVEEPQIPEEHILTPKQYSRADRSRSTARGTWIC